MMLALHFVHHFRMVFFSVDYAISTIHVDVRFPAPTNQLTPYLFHAWVK
jgi:hypothetical protein